MKTNEFIKKINDLGYYAKLKDYDEKVLYICHNNKGGVLQHIVAAVHIEKIGAINTLYHEFDRLNIDKQQQLLGLLSKYSRTPIEEREEEKKYMYRLKHVGGIEYIEDYRYLNYDTEYNSWTICDKTNAKVGTDTGEVFEVKYIFTHSELKSLGVDIEQLQEVYEEIEVEE